MSKFMFSILKRTDHVRGQAVPQGVRIYAIGDIHGQLSLLEQLHEKIRDDIKGKPNTCKSKIIYLGDYINRGAQSRGIIDRLIDNPIENTHALYLMGNHEFALIKFLSGNMSYAEWLGWGGDQTLLSYEIDVISPYADEEEIEALRKEFRSRIPARHYHFLSTLQPYQVEGDYLFVHAGIRPGIPLHEQKLQDLILIRDEFLRNPVTCGKTVIHGHTVFKTPHIRKNRRRIDSIGIDTGAYNTGKLTAIVLENEEYHFLTAQ